MYYEFTSPEILKSCNEIFYKIEYDNKTNIIFTQWLGNITVEKFKDGCSLFLTVLKRFSKKKPSVIVDGRDAFMNIYKVHSFLKEVYMPLVEELGVACTANIIAKNPIVILAINFLLNFIKTSIPNKAFHNYDEALKWIKLHEENI